MDTLAELTAIEEEFKRSIDTYASGDDAKAEHIANRALTRLRPLYEGEQRRQALMLAGFGLQIIQESEQALLRYEDVLRDNPDDEEALWQSIRVLLIDREDAAGARRLLEERLLPLSAKEEYQEALRMAKLAMGERTGKDATGAAADAGTP